MPKRQLFGFFSRYIDINSGFFVSELINSIKNKSEFITDKEDIVRDYVNPSDFYDLIKNCISNKKINDVFNVYSKNPASKFQILQEFSNIFDLKFKSIDNINSISPTGFKKIIILYQEKQKKIGYSPKFDSLDTLLNESRFIIKY